MLENILNGSWADRGINACLPSVLPTFNRYSAVKVDVATARVWARVMANAAVVAFVGAVVLSAAFSFKAVAVITGFSLVVMAVAHLTHRAAVGGGRVLGGADRGIAGELRRRSASR